MEQAAILIGTLTINRLERRRFNGFTQCNTAAVALLFILPSAAQSMPGMDHSHQPKKSVVKGADHPELIPDEEAYRAVFATIAEKPEVFLLPLNLKRRDQQAAGAIIVNYQKAFTELLNAQAHGGAVGPEFVTKANLLLKITKSELADKLSADGYERIETFVTQQKSAMTITTVTY